MVHTGLRRLLARHNRLAQASPRSRCRPRLETLEERTTPSVFLVTNNGDADYPTNGTYNGTGSLRQAIVATNLHPGLDTIQFNLPQDQATISLQTPLPSLADAVIIDGTSQAGYLTGSPVVLDGSSTFNYGLTITADGCTVRGLVLRGWRNFGIDIISNDNVVVSNIIDNNGGGILLSGGATGNRIGGSSSLSGSTIPSSEGNRIDFNGSGIVTQGAIGTVIEGNSISDSTSDGIDIEGGSGNQIGGVTEAAGNDIDENGGAGIVLTSETHDNLVQGNSLFGGGAGVNLASATSNVIRGTAPGAGNFLSDNLGPGVELFHEDTTGNQIEGNTIEFNSGSPGAPIPGVRVDSSTAAGNSFLANSIHDNTGLGIDIVSGGATPNNVPVLTSATLSPAGLNVGGTLTGPANQTFTIQFFASPVPFQGRPIQGQTFLGSTTATTDALGHASFLTQGLDGRPLLNVPPSNQFLLTATATGPDGSTSEFSTDLDLPAVSQTATPALVLPNEQVTYHVTVSNSTSVAIHPVLQDTLPGQSTFVSAAIGGTPATPTSAGPTTFDLGTLAASASVRIDITVSVGGVGHVTPQGTGLDTNTASVSLASSTHGSAMTTVSQAAATVELTPNQAFVAAAYLDLLHRPADLLPADNDAAGWVADLDAANATDLNSPSLWARARVAQTVESSDEYRGGVIQGMYHDLLHRSASPGEIDMWLHHTAFAGAAQIEADILGSTEYFNLRGGLSNAAFLDAIYRDVLNRPLDQTGAQTWMPLLPPSALEPGVIDALGTLSPDTQRDARTAITLQIVQSAESDDLLVGGLYQQLLHRQADAPGVQGFVASMQLTGGGGTGEPIETVRAAIIGSDEYFSLIGGTSRSTATLTQSVPLATDLSATLSSPPPLSVNTPFGIIAAATVNGESAVGLNGEPARLSVVSTPPNGALRLITGQPADGVQILFDGSGRALFNGLMATQPGSYTVRITDLTDGLSADLTFQVSD
jgi:uncharacterized repeat protein (TIGR01451 family)